MGVYCETTTAGLYLLKGLEMGVILASQLHLACNQAKAFPTVASDLLVRRGQGSAYRGRVRGPAWLLGMEEKPNCGLRRARPFLPDTKG